MRFDIKVQNNADNMFMPCASGDKCRVRYKKRYTPMLHDISPNSVYHGQELYYFINP